MRACAVQIRQPWSQIEHPSLSTGVPEATIFESPLRPNGENQAVTPGGFQEYRELVVHKRMIQDCAAQMELICTGNLCLLIPAFALLLCSVLLCTTLASPTQ
jgi:hypothetical protein